MAFGDPQVTFVVERDALRQVTAAFGQVVRARLIQAMREEGERVMARAKELVPVDLGVLRDSGFVTVETGRRGPDAITATVGFGGASFPYAIYLHEGTGPAAGEPAFMPPWRPGTPLGEWARRHGIERPYRLALKIGQHGLTGRKFLERAFNEARQDMDLRLADAVQRAMGQSLRGRTGRGLR